MYGDKEDPKRFKDIPDLIYQEIHKNVPLVCVDGYVCTPEGGFIS